MLKLKVYGTGSKGNSYELSNNGSSLLLDIGVKNANYDFTNVKGIVATHFHQDHCGAVKNIKDYYKGKYYSHREVLDVLPILDTYKVELTEYEPLNIENYTILAFGVNHDVLNYNYLIKDNISNMKILYMTDLSNINDYQFKDIDVFIVEANYNEDEVDYEDMKTQRLIQTHSSLQETIQFLSNNINVNTKKIFLIHISRSCEDYKYFEQYVKEKIQNDSIDVVAINPKLIKPLEFNLQKEIKIEFD